jgi:hypothetical protein
VCGAIPSPRRCRRPASASRRDTAHHTIPHHREICDASTSDADRGRGDTAQHTPAAAMRTPPLGRFCKTPCAPLTPVTHHTNEHTPQTKTICTTSWPVRLLVRRRPLALPPCTRRRKREGDRGPRTRGDVVRGVTHAARWIPPCAVDCGGAAAPSRAPTATREATARACCGFVSGLEKHSRDFVM